MAKYKDWLTDEGLLKIKQWARLGLTDEQIAKNMHITSSTFYAWKNRFSEISEHLKKGRERAVETIENAMFDKAVGFERGKNYYPPDTGAAIFLLKNWAKEQYRDKPYNEKELKKLELENEQLEMKNELMRRLIEGDGELDKLEELIKGIDDAAIEETEPILE